MALISHVVLFNFFKNFTVNKVTYLSVSKGNSIPSRYPRAATSSSGFPSDSAEHRPEGTTDDTTRSGSYANDQPSSSTPSWGTLNRMANHKGLFISLEL